MRKGIWKGVKLIELAVAVVVVGLLFSLLLYRYEAFSCRSMQSEAKFSLREAYMAQKLYHNEHDRFASFETLSSLEQRVFIPQKYYRIEDSKAPAQDSFMIIAKGAPDTLVAQDIWSIDEHNNLQNLKNACSP